MLHDSGVLIVWGVVLLAALVLAVKDLRRQTGSTDVWTHVTYRPVRRPQRPRPPKFHRRMKPRDPGGWDFWHDDYA